MMRACTLGDVSTQGDAPIVTVFPTVTVFGQPIAIAAGAGGEVHFHGDSVYPAYPLTGSLTVTAGAFPVHREGDLRACVAHQSLALKNPSVFVGL